MKRATDEERETLDVIAADLAALPAAARARILETARRLIATYAGMTGTTLPSAQETITLPPGSWSN